MIQLGYSLPLEEHGPIAAYGYYFFNRPHYPWTNTTLRAAIVPVYLDAELGFLGALGPNTDLSIGVSGGGFADSYPEIRQGDYKTDESFLGHGIGTTLNAYHLFNPGALAPLHGVLRGGFRASFYESDSDTASDFSVADDQQTFAVRAGLRYGGREPFLTPELAAELSIWYEGLFRLNPGAYGFDGDRQYNSRAHQLWARALLAYTFEGSGQYFEASLTAGLTLDADRFSAFRLGGSLPLIAEFPLMLPGYYLYEISADQFALLSGMYVTPIDAQQRWSVALLGSCAVVHYLDGLEQPGDFHSGVGGGVFYRSRNRAWHLGIGYGYGIQAIRDHGRGGQTLTFLVQYDLDRLERAGGRPFWAPVLNGNIWRGFSRILGR